MPSKRSWLADQRAFSFDAPGLIAGVDEAGRGPLAGPVVAAAVILDELNPIKGLKDSKRLGPRTRERLFDEIRAKALCCSIASASVEEIDALNILLREFAVPELIQGDATPERLAHAAMAWLDDPQRCAELQVKFQALHHDLRRDTAKTATDAIEKVLAR